MDVNNHRTTTFSKFAVVMREFCDLTESPYCWTVEGHKVIKCSEKRGSEPYAKQTYTYAIHGFYIDSSWHHSGLVTSITEFTVILSLIPSLLSGKGSGTHFHTFCAAYWYGNYNFRIASDSELVRIRSPRWMHQELGKGSQHVREVQEVTWMIQ